MLLMIVPVAAEVAADPVVMNLSKWYHDHPMPATPGISGEVVFKSPRAAVLVRQAPVGTKAAPHYHKIADEMVYIVSGSAELLINGDWVKLNPGDVHVNPRGIVHALNVTDPKGCKFVSVFTPPQPAAGDATTIPSGESLQAPAGLVDASPGAGMVVRLKEWQTSSVGPNSPMDFTDSMENDGLRGVTVTESPRSVLMLREAGYGAAHKHKQEQADEIIIVVSGSAHITSGDNSYNISQNDLQIVPMGSEHRMNLRLGESIRFLTLFALPENADKSKSLK